MRIDAVSIGKNVPQDVNVIIEVPVGGEPIKYEMDKEAGTLVVDRFLYTPMRYPGNYGFIPHTLSDDGDPCDVLIINTRAIIPGAVMSVRPVGVLFMEDEAGGDEKILAVPSSEADAALRQGEVVFRPAGHYAPADPALLRALQGSRTRQVGEDPALGRPRGCAQADPRRH
ncbi:inorganic pyrophosphatase [Bradyrhizobium sp. LM3.4]